MQDFHAAWVGALDRLELDVDVAERMLADHQETGLISWVEPDLRAPLPEDLVPRARLIHERQLAVADALTRRASSTAQQLALTVKVRTLVVPDVPVYVDLSA
jgi:hypothetical protein